MDTTVNVTPSAERDLGRVEGKMDILLATVARMEQDNKLAGQLVTDRFQSLTVKIANVERVCAEERQKIKDRVGQQGFRLILLALAFSGTQMPVKSIAALITRAL